MIEIVTAERISLIYVLCGLLVLWLGWIKALRPRVRRINRRVSAVLDTLGGRDEVHDEVTGKTLPAILPIHTRLSGIERAQADQAGTLNTLANVLKSQDALHRIATDHEARIQSLEDFDAERTLNREAERAMWDALNNKDVLDVDPEEKQ